MQFGTCCEPLLPQLGGFLGYEAAQHLGKWHKGQVQRAILLAGDMRGQACAPLPRVLRRAWRPRSFALEAEVGQ